MTRDLSDYVDVTERIRLFKAQYPEGSLQAYESPRVWTIGDKTYISYCAAAYRAQDDSRPGIGWAWEPVPGPTQFTRDSELMNAETSAWGRAIVALGFETKKIASANEVRNRQSSEPDGKDSPASHSGGQESASNPGLQSGSEGFQAPLSAEAKPATPGLITELNTVLKLLNSSYPENPGEGRTWEDVAKGRVRDAFQVDSVKGLSTAQVHDLIRWLEDQYQEAAREAAVPFGDAA